MIHAIGKSGSGGGGGGSGGATVSFSPPGGVYAGTSVSVTIRVTAATKLRWKIGTGAYTTVSATSTVVSVSLSSTLYADALDGNNNILATTSAFYEKNDGGGGGGQ